MIENSNRPRNTSPEKPERRKTLRQVIAESCSALWRGIRFGGRITALTTLGGLLTIGGMEVASHVGENAGDPPPTALNPERSPSTELVPIGSGQIEAFLSEVVPMPPRRIAIDTPDAGVPRIWMIRDSPTNRRELEVMMLGGQESISIPLMDIPFGFEPEIVILNNGHLLIQGSHDMSPGLHRRRLAHLELFPLDQEGLPERRQMFPIDLRQLLVSNQDFQQKLAALTNNADFTTETLGGDSYSISAFDFEKVETSEHQVQVRLTLDQVRSEESTRALYFVTFTFNAQTYQATDMTVREMIVGSEENLTNLRSPTEYGEPSGIVNRAIAYEPGRVVPDYSPLQEYAVQIPDFEAQLITIVQNPQSQVVGEVSDSPVEQFVNLDTGTEVGIPEGWGHRISGLAWDGDQAYALAVDREGNPGIITFWGSLKAPTFTSLQNTGIDDVLGALARFQNTHGREFRPISSLTRSEAATEIVYRGPTIYGGVPWREMDLQAITAHQGQVTAVFGIHTYDGGQQSPIEWAGLRIIRVDTQTGQTTVEELTAEQLGFDRPHFWPQFEVQDVDGTMILTIADSRDHDFSKVLVIKP